MTRNPSYDDSSRRDLDRLYDAARRDARSEEAREEASVREREGVHEGRRESLSGEVAPHSRRTLSSQPQDEESEQDESSSDTDETASEEEAPRKTSSSWVKKSIGQVLSGNILTRAEVQRMYPYVLFVAVLMFLYIANGYHIQKLHRRHDRISAQIKELRSRSLTLSSIRMTATRQSEIIKELETRGIPLEESLSPPKIINK